MSLPYFLQKLSLTLFISCAVLNQAVAEQIGIVAANGVEKLKVKNCGKTGGEYLYSFVLHTDGTWDYYDYDQDAYLPGAGSYRGTLQKRKLNLVAGSLYTNIFVDVVHSFAESLCGASLDVVSNTPIVYKVKINKNHTKAKAAMKFNVRGYSPAYGRYGTAKYSFSGAGPYGIEEI